MEIFLNFEVIRERENQMSKLLKNIKRSKGKINIKSKSDRAITLIALIVTIIVKRVFYDKNKKYSNLVGSSL